MKKFIHYTTCCWNEFMNTELETNTSTFFFFNTLKVRMDVPYFFLKEMGPTRLLENGCCCLVTKENLKFGSVTCRCTLIFKHARKTTFGTFFFNCEIHSMVHWLTRLLVVFVLGVLLGFSVLVGSAGSLCLFLVFFFSFFSSPRLWLSVWLY